MNQENQEQCSFINNDKRCLNKAEQELFHQFFCEKHRKVLSEFRKEYRKQLKKSCWKDWTTSQKKHWKKEIIKRLLASASSQ